MQQSFAVPYTHGRLFLTSTIRHILHIPRRTVLHCKIIDDTTIPSLIASTVPYEFWNRTTRITINTFHEPGSLRKVLDILKKVNLNILHLWASATSAQGELVVTALVSELSNEARTLNDLLDSINAAIGEQERDGKMLLSQSRLFEIDPSARVRVDPLKVLAQFHRLNVGPSLGALGRLRVSENFEIELNNGELNFAMKESGLTVKQMLTTAENSDGASALIALDTEERYIRISILPAHYYYEIRLPVTAQSPQESDLQGVTRDLVEVLSEKVGMNIYYAQSKLKSKFTNNGVHVEVSELTATGSLDIYRDYEERLEVRNLVRRSTEERLADRRGSEGISSASSTNLNLDCFSVSPMLAPFVFLATNAKADSDSGEYLKTAIDLCKMLKDLYFRPVFLNFANSTLGASGRNEMTRILDASPLLVSLYLPESRMKLIRDAGAQKFAPSAWTTFEEAYMRANYDRPIFRLIHSDVYSPPFLDVLQSWSFSSPAELEDRIDHLHASIRGWRQSAGWPNLVRRCHNVILKYDLARELVDRDPEEFLRRELKRSESMDFPR